MDGFEWNMIMGAVLGTLVFVFVVKTAAEIVYEAEAPAKPGYVVEGVIEEGPAGAAAPVAETMPDWGTVLASADAAAGKTVSGRCLQCHTLEKGGANKIGPNIYAVVDETKGEGRNGFAFSSAMKAKGGTWTYDELFHFLRSPGAYIPGTKMSFAGIRNQQDRINLIAFLRSNADAPAAIPAPKPVEAAAPAEGAAGAKPATGAAGAKPAEGAAAPAAASNPAPAGPEGGATGKAGTH
jgi:cytochrome c